MGSDVIEWVKLLAKLGLAVWEAVESGDRSKTVGEIFDGMPKDMDEIERLAAKAREHFER